MTKTTPKSAPDPKERDEFKSLSIRIRAAHVAKLADAKARLVYRVSSSALIERAIDLLVEDMKSKGELNG